MKKQIILCYFIISSLLTQAQSNNRKQDSVLLYFLNSNCYCDKMPNDPCARDKHYYYTRYQVLSTYTMNRLIRQDLTKITLDENGLPTLGNYATTQLSDDKATLTFNTSIYNPFSPRGEFDPIKSLLSFNIKAATKDNLSTLFSSNNVNSGVSIKTKLTLLNRRTSYYTDESDTFYCQNVSLGRTLLATEYKKARTRFVLDNSNYLRKLKNLETQSDVLKNRIKDVSDKIDSIQAILPHLTKEDSIKYALLKDSLFNILLDDKIKRQSVMDSNISLRQNEPFYDSAKLIDSFYRRLFDYESKAAKWKKFKVSWTDVDVTLGGEKYVLYDKSKSLDSQFTNRNFTQWTIGTSFNIFQSAFRGFLKHGYFLKIGYSIGNDNSLSGASTKEISTYVYIDTPSYRRQISEKQSAYDKPFTTNIQHLISGRFSKYLDEKRNQAFSLLVSAQFQAPQLKDFYKTSGGVNLTPGIAYLYGFQNKEKGKNTVNIEAFLQFDDLFNRDKADSHAYNRYDIGIRVGIPFNSIFLNQ